MRRVVYCPDESMLDKAIELSKTNFLPIQLGDSLGTTKLSFDRDVISVVEIPEFIHYKKIQNVYVGFHQIVHYTNDFIDFDDTLKISFNSTLFLPVMTEKHNARFAFVCNDIGFFSADIMYRDEVMESFDFYVD